MRKRHNLLMVASSRAVAAVALSLAAATAAAAQDSVSADQAAEAGDADSEDIVVTGSNIRSSNLNSTSPIIAVDEALIDNTAAVSVQDLFKGVTANAGSQQANEQNALQGVRNSP